MTDDIAINVKGISKRFLLPHERATTVKGLFTGMANKHNAKSTETQHALEDISFTVKKGEFFGIVGRNGSGKSTMLKILAGIYQPTQGEVDVRGRLVPFIELGVGFNGELTGRENVYLNGAMLGFSEKEIDTMYDGIVKFAELERFMDQKLKNYSSGMQVRLAFSMATRADADILLVDEVLAVGDADFQRKCFAYFKNLKKNKKTVVFVSHDMSAVRQYCDRAVLIESSRLVKQGSASLVATEYTKMFNGEDTISGSTMETQKRRWGNKKATIKSVTITPKLINSKSKDVSVKVEILSNQQNNDLVIGFVIKDASFKDIVGTNTRVAGVSTGEWSQGQQKQIIWTLPSIFSDGNYTVDVAVLENDASSVCDWWESSATFSSREDIPSVYAVSPLINTEISEVPNV